MNHLKEIILEIDTSTDNRLKVDLSMKGIFKDPVIGEYESVLKNTFYSSTETEAISKLIENVEGHLSLAFNNDYFAVSIKSETLSSMLERVKQKKVDDKVYMEYLIPVSRFRVYSQAYGGIELLPKKTTENTLISIERVDGLSRDFQTEEVVSINTRYALYNQY